MTTGELKLILEDYAPDCEVFIWFNEDEQGYEIEGTHDDEAKPGQRGFFISTGKELAPL